MKYNFTYDEINSCLDTLKSIFKFNVPNYTCMYLHRPSVYNDDIYEAYDGISARISIFYTYVVELEESVGLILNNGLVVDPLLNCGIRRVDPFSKRLIRQWINSIESKERQIQRCGLIKNELIEKVELMSMI